MDLATLAGITVAFGCLLVASLMEGGGLGGFVNLPAFLIVFGGTTGATMLSQPLGTLKSAVAALRKVVFSQLPEPTGAVTTLVRLARKARVDGVLSLESELDGIEDQFLRRGITLVVDGNDPEVVKSILEGEIESMQQRHKARAGVFAAMGGFAPTLGVLGTVMGLIHMLAQLSEPGKMGGAIAAAFVATMYGVGSANLVFLPIATKLGERSKEEAALREMMMEGVLGLQAGDNPLTLEERLKAFLSPQEREAQLSQEEVESGGEQQEAA